jgi:plasmid maintenance system antidote protein VapI
MTRSQPNQRRVIVTRDERLMLQPMRLSDDVRLQLQKETPRSLELWLSIDEADDLREQVQDALQVNGFDENYRLTAAGKVLESLVDKLFTG